MQTLYYLIMGRWKKIQKELIQKALRGEKVDIVQENYSSGRVHGTIYYKKGVSSSRGILLVHGFSGNRYGMGILAERLAEYGFFCLSIDLPSHFLNLTRFTLGELSETITDGVLVLKNHFGIPRIAVIGHSMGAIGSLFSNAGYNTTIENSSFLLWEKMRLLIDEEAELIKNNKDHNKIIELTNKIDSLYTELVFTSIQMLLAIFFLLLP
jgi:esterase/lipase